ncbi:hypothetical protein DAI22_08g063600 [Oryza sativa Japonica Group]|nr:hypothetical protein DAI22_08g063600 [Oryza sativa Japonica Group]
MYFTHHFQVDTVCISMEFIFSDTLKTVQYTYLQLKRTRSLQYIIWLFVVYIIPFI